MLKTNSKKAKENIKAYIMENYNADGYEENEPEAMAKTFEEVATVILADVVRVEGWRKNTPKQTMFIEWAKGLPGLLDTCYYYNRSAIEDLKNILEETDEEANRYTEAQAEELLSRLIYRELANGTK